jgi:hypothetical protein
MGVPGRVQHSRSVREDHVILDIQRQVSSRHPVYLWVTDICRGGEQRPQDAATRAGVEASHSSFFIYIGQCLLKIGSYCGVIYSHR